MTGTTPRFGFTTLNKGDELSANDYAFGRLNRLQLDWLLRHAIENHKHSGVSAPQAPPPPPSVQVLPTGGVLPANHTVFYRTALVDSDGQEFLGSQTATVVTPPLLPVPEAPVLSQQFGGSLDPGNYLYQCSAYTQDTGFETTLSAPTSGVLAAGNMWSIRFPVPPSGVTGWNIYRKAPTDLEPIFLTNFPVGTTEFFDTGTFKPLPYRTAPVANTTSSMNSAYIGYNDYVPSGYTCKIFRTLDQGDWNRSLVAHVARLPYTDTGHAAQTGAPLSRSVAIGGAPKIRLGLDTEGTLPPRSSTTARVASFNIAGPVSVGLSPWQWVCDFDDAVIVSMRVSLGRGSVPAATPVTATVRVLYGWQAAWVPMLSYASDPMGQVGVEITAQVPVGASSGTPVTMTSQDDNVKLQRGDALRAVILQSGGGATPTDVNLSLSVTMLVRNSYDDQSYVWKDT